MKEIRYIFDFRQNFISPSRLNSIDYKWRAEGEILKILHNDRMILEEKKRTIGHYYPTESLVRDGASGTKRTLESSGAPSRGGSSMRCETRKDNGNIIR